jgi:hypothetical protein
MGESISDGKSTAISKLSFDSERPTPVYRIEQPGWTTELDASATIHLPPAELQHVVLRLRHDNIRVTDVTRDRIVKSGTIQLDLHSAAGHVRQSGK